MADLLHSTWFIILAAFTVSFLLSFLATPFVKIVAEKVGAVDLPNARRINKVPMPRMGGLAIFYGFIVSSVCFCDMDKGVRGILIGAAIITLLGVLDDIYQLRAITKLAVQIGAALFTASQGVVIYRLGLSSFTNGDKYIEFGAWAIPITVIWIVVITNAVNLIDGLDGLAVGVSSISSISVLCIALLVSELNIAAITAALAGACFGFLPYNMNPAKIFMGDTGSNFLGYILATVSIQGLFKGYAVISFIVPLLILGLPLFDTGFAIIRRVMNHRPIMEADRGHIHHRLMDMGFSQKQSVGILYIICTVLCLSAVVLISSGPLRALLVIAVTLVLIVIAARRVKLSNLLDEDEAEKSEKKEKKKKHD